MWWTVHRHKVYLINLTVQTNKLKFHFDTICSLIFTIRVLNNGAFHTQTADNEREREKEREMMQSETHDTNYCEMHHAYK